MSDYDEVLSALSRMREPMVKEHPEQLTGAVSDVLECALLLELYQKELIEARSSFKKLYEKQLMLWEVSQHQFVTTAEKKLRGEIDRVRQECKAQLDQRNETTKVWIQAETQTREYCQKLERILESRGINYLSELDRL